jgi:predicted ester cyclase
MGTSESRELMRRITEEIWENGRLELVDELIAEDLVDHLDIPGVETTGRQRYYDSVVLNRTAFPDLRNPLDLIIADDDLAVSYGRLTGTNTGELWGMPPTGRSVDLPMVGILRFRDGQAIERWGVFDSAIMMQQLGLVE